MSRGPEMHGAPTAWVAGITGAASIIAIIDTGIFAGESELSGRISSDSTGINGNADHNADMSFEAQDGSLHGTEVAMVAAAANDGAGTVGIAYDATIMMIRADDPGSCADDDGCSFNDISDGIEWAVEHGATVINISLGGSPASLAEEQAIRDAADAGVVVVISAGNDGANRPDDFAQDLAEAGNGNVIIVGSVTANGTISSFSNKARGYQEYYIAALGSNVTVVEDEAAYESPGTWQISGTSFSAPQVAGAVALIKQAFPAMTGQEIVELLLDTAQDVGVAGPDDVYGMGILDIYEAFQPQGLTTLAGSDTPMREGDDAGVTSAAMGDALEGGLSLQAVMLDRFDRAYSTEISGFSTARPARRLDAAVGREQRFESLGVGNASLAFTLDASDKSRRPWTGQLRLSQDDAEASRVLAARVAMKLSPDTDIGFAFAESADGLVGQLQGQDRPAFMIAQGATGDDGSFRTTDLAFALRRKAGNWGLTVSAESGKIVSAAPLLLAEDVVGRQKRDLVRSFGIAADRDWGPLDASFALTWMDEDSTLLGARFHDGFGASGANTLFVDVHAGWDFAQDWRLGGAWRGGLTQADAGGIVTSASRLWSQAWSVDMQHLGVFGASDSLGLRVSQPLRVERGGLALNLPVAFSYETLTATYLTRTLSLSPKGRELMSEFAWRGPLLGGSGSASLFYRREPGHFASLPNDKGVALRWHTRF